MNNANQPAMPMILDMNDPSSIRLGLTKREHFAGLALQGLLAYTGTDECIETGALAEAAVHYADLLLKELEGENYENRSRN